MEILQLCRYKGQLLSDAVKDKHRVEGAPMEFKAKDLLTEMSTRLQVLQDSL